jgi:hypothetical protein
MSCIFVMIATIMTYDFSRFSPQSFERFVQAMAAAAVGGSVQVFGAGKDGGREAVFEGEAAIADTRWNGYVVFQAKHRQYPGKPAEDVKWLIAQIDEELAKFADPRRNLKRPEYYVLATNLRLTAAAADPKGKGAGGIDKVTRHLRTAALAVGIQDVHLWHADTLSSLLDAHRSVRDVFAFWVQPGDVLAALLRALEGPHQGEILLPYLRRSLRQAREIKTRDIGQAVGRTVALDEVFVDLPIEGHSRNPYRADEFEAVETDPELIASLDQFESSVLDEMDIFDGRSVAAELMRRAARKIEPQAPPLILDKRYRKKQKGPLSNRVVLLGGPGQGKSTIGQFIAQLCRARLLDTLQVTQSAETNQAVEAVLDCARAERIPLFGPLRYPFHIELPRYADALSAADGEGRGLSLLAYVAQEISKGSDRAITAATLKQWLGTIPAMIILDGLDEVPRSGNREATVKAIEDLLDTVHEMNSDCLIFCTSRPQGYQEELSPKLWGHWTLEPLEGSTALRLASRVSAVLISEETRRDEILATLADSARDPTTAPLMISPLQVMLLFQLVATHNNIPKDRWTLFHRHYETLRDREIAKGGATGQTIREYRSQIDSIHQDVGYLLHLRAEGAGGANAYLSDMEFERLVAARLERDGFEADAETLAPEIANLATNRLVFLRSQVDGQVAFDVRSLQEFMAAARLTASPESLIRERLFEIAGRSHWLHVFKIACSKIYASNAHEALRAPTIGLLDSLDAGDRSLDDRLLKSGARLALQLLDDGTATGVPVYRRQLTVRALRLLGSTQDADQYDLRRVIRLDERAHLEPLLTENLSGGDEGLRQQTLRLLAYVARYGSPVAADWSQRLLLAQLPSEPAALIGIFDTAGLLPTDPELAARLRYAQWQLHPAEVVRWVGNLTFNNEEIEIIPKDVLICSAMPQLAGARLAGTDLPPTNFVLRYRSARTALSMQPAPDSSRGPGDKVRAMWATVSAAQRFAEAPDIARAVDFLETIAANPGFEHKRIGIPWPLRGLLLHAEHHAGFDATLAALQAGDFGAPDSWFAAEARWEAEGIRVADVAVNYSAATMQVDWCHSGAPHVVNLSGERAEGDLAVAALLELIGLCPAKSWPIHFLSYYATRNSTALESDVIAFFECFDPAAVPLDPAHWQTYGAALIAAYGKAPSKQLFDRLRVALPNIRRLLVEGDAIRLEAAATFNEPGSSRELLRLIAAGFKASQGDTLPTLPDTAFEMLAQDTPQIRSAVAMLRVIAERDDAMSQETIEGLLDGSRTGFAAMLTNLVRGRRGPKGVELAMAICREALTVRVGDWLETCHTRFASLTEGRPVALSDPDRALALALPLALRTREEAA